MPSDPYAALLEQQRNWLFGLPESEPLEEMLKLRVTPGEAAFLARIPHFPNSLEQLAQRLDMPPEDLAPRLASLAARGLVMQIPGKQGPRFMLADAFFWFYRMPGYQGLDDDWNRRMAPLLNRYYTGAMAGAVLGLKTRGLRTIPVGKTVADSRGILPFEDVARVVDDARAICVTHCACRHRKNLDPDAASCTHETETCLHLDALAFSLLRNGIGRELTKDEARGVLARAADAGLVHAVSNMKSGIDTICNCCACCCAFLESRAALPRAVIPGHQPSAYSLAVDRALCQGCGLCARRCPTGAIQQPWSKKTAAPDTAPGGMLTLHEDKCLGCGACAHKCPTGALSLTARPAPPHVPADALEFTQRVLTEQGLNPAEVFKRNT